MRTFLLISLTLALWACGGEDQNGQSQGESPSEEKAKGMDTVITSRGEFTVYFPDGSVHIEGQLDLEGNRTGVWRSYFQGGQLNSVNHYFKGKLDGISVVFRGNGKKYYEGEYHDGEPVGVWKKYDEQGNMTLDSSYVKQ